MVIDAYAELITLSRFDRAGFALLRDLTASEVQRFRVLRPEAGWTADAIDDALQDFLVEKITRVTEGALATAVDAESLGGYLRKSIRNHLVDRARRTPRGRVRRKLEELLRGEERFTKTADFWHPATTTAEPFGGADEVLVRAAYAVPDVQPKSWSGNREAPIAADADLLRILDALFVAAGGSLSIGVLTEVLVQRFPSAVTLADSSLDQNTYRRAATVVWERPDLAAEFSATAAAVVEGLSAAERVLVPVLDAPISEQMTAVGLGRTQTYQLGAQVREKLAARLPSGEPRAAVLSEVVRLCSSIR